MSLFFKSIELALAHFRSNHSDKVAQIEKNGAQIEAGNLTGEYSNDIPFNTVLPGGITVHTLGQYREACDNYWKNHVE